MIEAALGRCQTIRAAGSHGIAALAPRPHGRLTQLRPGVFPLPENPVIAVQQVNGSDHPGDARTRRAFPIGLDAMPSNGMATCAGVTPAPRAARTI
jgi:hypothetical protein